MTYIDTRELAEELDALIERRDAGEGTDEEAERILALVSVLEDIGDEARYGVTLIPEDEFEDYAQELAEDIGAIPADVAWPCTCIDWEKAARELRMDYTSITFDGVDYLARV